MPIFPNTLVFIIEFTLLCIIVFSLNKIFFQKNKNPTEIGDSLKIKKSDLTLKSVNLISLFLFLFIAVTGFKLMYSIESLASDLLNEIQNIKIPSSSAQTPENKISTLSNIGQAIGGAASYYFGLASALTIIVNTFVIISQMKLQKSSDERNIRQQIYLDKPTLIPENCKAFIPMEKRTDGSINCDINIYFYITNYGKGIGILHSVAAELSSGEKLISRRDINFSKLYLSGESFEVVDNGRFLALERDESCLSENPFIPEDSKNWSLKGKIIYSDLQNHKWEMNFLFHYKFEGLSSNGGDFASSENGWSEIFIG